MKELIEIQKKLKVGKGERNNFGNYNYRTCEGILEAVKPLLGDCSLTLSDEMVLIGDRYYIKSRAWLKFPNGADGADAYGYARECQIKKGMDEAQITGAASSYARKYALCGLFLIDGGEDPDKGNNSKTTKKETPKKEEPPIDIIRRINYFYEKELPSHPKKAAEIVRFRKWMAEQNFTPDAIYHDIKTAKTFWDKQEKEK